MCNSHHLHVEHVNELLLKKKKIICIYQVHSNNGFWYIQYYFLYIEEKLQHSSLFTQEWALHFKDTVLASSDNCKLTKPIWVFFCFNVLFYPFSVLLPELNLVLIKVLIWHLC